jgi:endonuclease/exonuclease/phosphatase family metal-dependent hydrolase
VPLVARTWNLFHGNALPPERRDFLREMVALVTADAPDIVCLQELPVWAVRRLERWSGMHVVSAVARPPRLRSAEVGRVLTELHHGRLRSAFTGEADAILVGRGFRASDTRVAVVSSAGLRRIVHGVRLDGELFVANAHTTGDEQLRRVAEFVRDEPQVVLAGDFNLRPPYEALRDFSQPLDRSIDQVLVRGLAATPAVAWPVERRRVRGRVVSDHAPVELRVG